MKIIAFSSLLLFCSCNFSITNLPNSYPQQPVRNKPTNYVKPSQSQTQNETTDGESEVSIYIPLSYCACNGTQTICSYKLGLALSSSDLENNTFFKEGGQSIQTTLSPGSYYYRAEQKIINSNCSVNVKQGSFIVEKNKRFNLNINF